MKLEKDGIENKSKIIRIIIQSIVLLILLIVSVIAIIKLYPIFVKIQNDEQYRDLMIQKIDSFGGFSWLIIIGIQILQTVLAIIPSGPVVIIAGMLYSPWLSVIICLVGQTIGALIVIGLVKIFGYSFICLFINPDKIKSFKILENERKCAVLMFSYLLIPLLPKDPIAFIVPFTKVKAWKFAIISFVARTPMTIVSVIFGSSLINGEYILGIIIASISALLALVCFIFNNKIVAFIDQILENRKIKE